ncbi:MAG TPA: hypothetical protein VFL92_09515 [Sphingomonas sp.]|nr:hypothetical protein [Sphingomonas sp.]
MMIITDLSPAARAELIAFCAENLKPGYDPETYADGLIAEADFSDGFAHFEIKGLHTRIGNPVTTRFDGEADFVREDHPEADEA